MRGNFYNVLWLHLQYSNYIQIFLGWTLIVTENAMEWGKYFEYDWFVTLFNENVLNLIVLQMENAVEWGKYFESDWLACCRSGSLILSFYYLFLVLFYTFVLAFYLLSSSLLSYFESDWLVSCRSGSLILSSARWHSHQFHFKIVLLILLSLLSLFY